MTIQIIALFIDLSLALSITLAAAGRPRKNATRSLSLLALFVAIWTLCDILLRTIVAADIHAVLVAAVYLAATLAASAQLVYAISQSNREHWVSRIPLLSLLVMPLVTQMLFWVQPWHIALFGVPEARAGAMLLASGTWGKLNALYIFGLMGSSVLLLWNMFFERPRATLRPFGAVLLGSLLPPAAATLVFAGAIPSGDSEIIALGFTLACAAYSYYYFQPSPELVASIDRNAVVEGMDDGWMVLDHENTVVDMNGAAERMAGLARAQVLGHPVTSVLNGLPNLGQSFDLSQELEMKRSIKSEDGWKYLNIRIAPLTARDGTRFGRLAVWHDVTERKLAEDGRQRARDEMLVLLNAISSTASNVVDLDEFLSDSIYHIIYPFRSQVAGIFLLDDQAGKKHGQGFRLTAHLGFSPRSAADLGCIPVSSPLFASLLEQREPLQVEDVSTDTRLPPPLRDMDLACLLLLPLVTRSGEDRQVLGCICLARKQKQIFSPDELVRLGMISDQVASLIDGDRRRKLAITSTERKRVIRDLHDSVTQKLYGLVATTEAAQASIEAGKVVDPTELLTSLGESARQALKEMRLFLYQMQPIDMEQDGLISLLHHRLAAVEGRADIKAQFHADLTDEEIALSKPSEITLYYIAMEGLNNVLKHAAAQAVSVTLKQGRRNVILEIRDDGCGFDPRKVERGGLGLISMQERTAQIHGKLQITSKPAGGTRVVITVPRDPSIQIVKSRR